LDDILIKKKINIDLLV